MIRFLLYYLAELTTKLVGAFNPWMSQHSTKTMIIMVEVRDQGAEITVRIPKRTLEVDPDYAQNCAYIVPWVLSRPNHYWTATELGIDTMEEAKRVASDS